jgi:hypothetical protein
MVNKSLSHVHHLVKLFTPMLLLLHLRKITLGNKTNDNRQNDDDDNDPKNNVVYLKNVKKLNQGHVNSFIAFAVSVSASLRQTAPCGCYQIILP